MQKQSGLEFHVGIREKRFSEEHGVRALPVKQGGFLPLKAQNKVAWALHMVLYYLETQYFLMTVEL